ncbi:hypothetical protein NDU88_005975 [Pleurodeles waltl]|uniref:Uncharacterized protein n=1 Tax=Pleurodeles waltl TaxID=8319 RepID=A0AAV7X045_PLEWA|nr:hypothetical protein NDU88_005975 [Pleurodeles waltl]
MRATQRMMEKGATRQQGAAPDPERAGWWPAPSWQRRVPYIRETSRKFKKAQGPNRPGLQGRPRSSRAHGTSTARSVPPRLHSAQDWARSDGANQTVGRGEAMSVPAPPSA